MARAKSLLVIQVETTPTEKMARLPAEKEDGPKKCLTDPSCCLPDLAKYGECDSDYDTCDEWKTGIGGKSLCELGYWDKYDTQAEKDQRDTCEQCGYKGGGDTHG